MPYFSYCITISINIIVTFKFILDYETIKKININSYKIIILYCYRYRKK